LQLPLEPHKIQPPLSNQHLCLGWVVTKHPR
jgi:hypothetical protein